MSKRILMIVGWAMATLATSAITLAAVSQAGDEVSDRPAIPVSAEDLAERVFAADSSSSTTTSTTTSLSSTTTTADSSSTSVSISISTTTTTTDATSSSSTIPAAAGSVTESRTTPGGTVTVTADVGGLRLFAAIPAQGFTADIEAEGSAEVEVKFEKPDESIEYVVRARLEDGEISWEIRTEVDD